MVSPNKLVKTIIALTLIALLAISSGLLTPLFPNQHNTLVYVQLALLLLLTGLIVPLLRRGDSPDESAFKSIIPDRVRSAFNALAEGLLILDENFRILLANDSFSCKTGYIYPHLIGKTAVDLLWKQ
ncbi:MAG: PAS domain-containing protein, partial [Candidatus Thiodiazotropha sp.]